MQTNSRQNYKIKCEFKIKEACDSKNAISFFCNDAFKTFVPERFQKLKNLSSSWTAASKTFKTWLCDIADTRKASLFALIIPSFNAKMNVSIKAPIVDTVEGCNAHKCCCYKMHVFSTSKNFEFLKDKHSRLYDHWSSDISVHIITKSANTHFNSSSPSIKATGKQTWRLSACIQSWKHRSIWPKSQ